MCGDGVLKNARYMQYFAALSGSISFAAASMYIAWSSPSIPILISDQSPIGRKITSEEGSWIASSVSFGMMAGSFFYWMVDVLGRKKTILLTNIPLLIGWIVIYFTKSVFLICAVRFVAGMAMTVIITSCAIYNAEIAEKDIRGKLGSYLNLIRILGSFIVLAIGPFVTYYTLLLIGIIPPLICLATFSQMPESPYFLVRKGKSAEARKMLNRLTSNNADKEYISNLLQEIEDTVQFDMRNKTTVWEFLSNGEYRNAIIIMAGVKSLQLLCGTIAIEGYLQPIIEQTGSSISPEMSSMLFGAIQFPAALISAELVDKMGRKPLLLISSAGCSVALIAEGIYFYLQNVMKTDVTTISWLPTSGILLFLIMNPIGVFTLPYVLLGELFPTNIKGIAISVFTLYGGFLSFGTSKLFSPISEGWGIHVTFWLFAGFCILGFLFVICMLPETKGKTFTDIQLKLNKNRKT